MADQADRLRELRLVPGAARPPKESGRRPAVRSLALVSGKGGVGKSALAANLALAFARARKRVLLVDGDLSLANADLLLGMVPRQNLGDVVLGNAPIEDVVMETPDGILLLPAASGIEELADLDDFRREQLLRELSKLEQRADLLLFDLGSGIGRQTIHLARAADRVLVVTTPEPTAFADAYATIKVLARGRLRSVPALVVNMARTPDEGRETARRIRAVAERFLGLKPEFLGAIPYDEAMPRAVRSQEPLLRIYPHCPAAKEMERLAGSLLAEPEGPAPIEVDTDESFFLKASGGTRRG